MSSCKLTRQSCDDFSAKEWGRKHEFNMHSKKGRYMEVAGLGNALRIKGRMDTFGGRALLQQEDGEVVAVIIRERTGRHFAYKLLSPTARCPAQKPHRIRIEDQEFYEQMTIRRTSYFANNFVIQEVGEEDVSFVVRDTSRFGPLQLKVFEMGSDRCCGTVRQFFEHDDVSSSAWKVQTGKELSPKLMVCLTAIASKSLGKLYQ